MSNFYYQEDTSFVKERNWKVSTYSKAVLKLQYPFYKMPQQRSANSYQVPNKSQSPSQPSICVIQTFAITSEVGVLQSQTKFAVNGKELKSIKLWISRQLWHISLTLMVTSMYQYYWFSSACSDWLSLI